jgi:hypothetical protein
MFDSLSEPGPVLAAALEPLVGGDLTDYEVVDAIAGWDRMVSWATARQAELVSELAHRRCLVGVHEGERTPRRDEVDEFAADELALHLRLTKRAAEARLAFALGLERLTRTAAALRAGQIDARRAAVIADAVLLLTDAAAAQVEQRVLPGAAEQTTGQLRACCAREVIRTDPKAADRRHRAACRERAAVLTPAPDGMAELLVRLRADTAVAVWAVLDTLARQPRRAGRPRAGRGRSRRSDRTAPAGPGDRRRRRIRPCGPVTATASSRPAGSRPTGATWTTSSRSRSARPPRRT